MAVDAAREEKALSQAKDRLVDAYAEAHTTEQVEAVFGAARKRFDGHRIREFIPILVERIVRRELEPGGTDNVVTQVDSVNSETIPAGDDSNSNSRHLDATFGRMGLAARQYLPEALTRRKWALPALAGGVVVLVVAGLAIAGGGSDSTPAPVAGSTAVTTVQGVVGSEKLAFFNDPKVAEALAEHGLKVEVEPAGSRQIATTVDLGKYDFAFPSSASAAERIQRQRNVSAKYTPFSSPMAVATFKPIVELLTAAGVVKPGATPTLDVEKYLALAERGVQWDQLEGNTSYPVKKNVLVSTTDPRTSNSAAMYLAVAAYVANDNAMVRGAAAEDHAVARVSRLFTRQGYTENSTDGPFKEYLANGMGPTPMVWIYEAQYVDAAAHGQLKPDMVLMYPSPTVLSQHTVVPLNGNGDRLGKLLATDADLQRLAAEHGFRPNDASLFTKVATQAQVPVVPNLIDVVDAPNYDTLEHLLDGVAKAFN